jgi:hypothetical protein
MDAHVETPQAAARTDSPQYEYPDEERVATVQTLVRELLHTFRTEERRQLSFERCVAIQPPLPPLAVRVGFMPRLNRSLSLPQEVSLCWEASL